MHSVKINGHSVNWVFRELSFGELSVGELSLGELSFGDMSGYQQ